MEYMDEARTRTKRTDADEDRDLFDHNGCTRDLRIFSNSGEAQSGTQLK